MKSLFVTLRFGSAVLLRQKNMQSLGRYFSTSKIRNGLLIEDKNSVRRIYFNRPEKKNAMTLDMYKEASESIYEANLNNNINLIVLSGKGDYFSSGNDLNNFIVDPDQTEKRLLVEKYVGNYMEAFIDCKKPVIALVNGNAIGIGTTILGLCDLVYASENAILYTPFTALGISPEACSSYTFPKIMGYAKAMDVLAFNNKMTAKEACQRNLITAVFPQDKFEEETSKRINDYSKLPIKSLIYSKELMRGREIELLKSVHKAETVILRERMASEDVKNAFKNLKKK